MIKIRLLSPLHGIKRGPKTDRGKRHASQNARKYNFSRQDPLNAQDEKHLEEIRHELFDADDVSVFPHDGLTLFMSVRKAARVRREIESVMVKMMDNTHANKLSEFNHDLDRLSRLHDYERRARSAVATNVMKGSQKVSSKLSQLRRKVTRETKDLP